MSKTKIVSGFAGIGKTHLKQNSDLKILDLDSKEFKDALEDQITFDEDYPERIKEEYNSGNWDIILVSTHWCTRTGLTHYDIPFDLVYPTEDCKDEYLERYKNRDNNNEQFIGMMEFNFGTFVYQLAKNDDQLDTDHGNRIELKPGEYLSDILVN
jgi:hypothetical protein